MDDHGADGARTLRRIADALGVPVERLFLPDKGQGAPTALCSEVRALIRAFACVTNPETRAHLIRIAEGVARAERTAVGPEH